MFNNKLNWQNSKMSQERCPFQSIAFHFFLNLIGDGLTESAFHAACQGFCRTKKEEKKPYRTICSEVKCHPASLCCLLIISPSFVSQELATEIILTLGEAFEVAYQVVMRERGHQESEGEEPPGSPTKSSTASDHQVAPVQQGHVESDYWWQWSCATMFPLWLVRSTSHSILFLMPKRNKGS